MNIMILCLVVCSGVQIFGSAGEKGFSSKEEERRSPVSVTFSSENDVRVFGDGSQDLSDPQYQTLNSSEREALIVKRNQAIAKVPPSNIEIFYQTERKYITKLKGKSDVLPFYIFRRKAEDLSEYYESVITYQKVLIQKNVKILEDLKSSMLKKSIWKISDFRADLDKIEMDFEVHSRNNPVEGDHIKESLNKVLEKYEKMIILHRAQYACVKAYELFEKDMREYALKYKDAYKKGIAVLNEIHGQYFDRIGLKPFLSIKQLKECFQKSHDRSSDPVCKGDLKAGTQHLFSMDDGKIYESEHTHLKARFKLPTNRGSRLIWVLDDEI